MAVIDFFDHGWAGSPEGLAFVSQGEEWTYERAGRTSCRIANALTAATEDFAGTKVAVLSPNSAAAWICVLGIWRAGGVWVPLNPQSPAESNAALIDRFDVDVLFYAPELAEQADRIRVLASCGRLIPIDDSRGQQPGLWTWIEDASDAAVEPSGRMDDTVVIASTGGTTGVPKGVMNTHRSLAAMVAHQLMAFHYEPGERIVNLAAAPMTHTAGLLTLQTTVRGGTVAIIQRADVDRVVEAVERFGVTEMFLPPTVVYRLLNRLEETTPDLSSLKYLVYGSAPMSVGRLRSGIERLGPIFMEGYGQMEAVAAISFLRPGEHLAGGEVAPDDRLGSCGRPYPLVKVQIRDAVTGEPVGRGETGEICVRGDLVMKGYYRDEQQTAQVLIDGWLHTGDLGHLDAEGYLHLTDRKKDMIITGGFNVYPSQVEQVIWAHPAVSDCAVVGAPDDDWGERVTAVVELKPRATVTAAELIERCRAELGSVNAPKDVVFVDQLPRSVNGKVLKRDVRDRFWVGHERAI